MSTIILKKPQGEGPQFVKFWPNGFTHHAIRTYPSRPVLVGILENQVNEARQELERLEAMLVVIRTHGEALVLERLPVIFDIHEKGDKLTELQSMIEPGNTRQANRLANLIDEYRASVTLLTPEDMQIAQGLGLKIHLLEDPKDDQ